MDKEKNSIKWQGNGTCFRCNIFSWEIDISHTIVAVSHIIIKRLLIRISLSYICSQIGGRITRDETIMTASAYHPSPSTWENWNEKNTTTFLGTASILGQGIHGMEKIPKKPGLLHCSLDEIAWKIYKNPSNLHHIWRSWFEFLNRGATYLPLAQYHPRRDSGSTIFEVFMQI